MTFKQFFPIPVGIAILAFFLMLIAWGSGKCANYGQYFVIWIAFQAWAMYFMAGCTLQGGVHSGDTRSAKIRSCSAAPVFPLKTTFALCC